MPARKTLITEAQARALHNAESAVKDAKKALEAAEEARDELRGAYRPLIPLADDKTDRAKGVRTISILGGKIRVCPTRSGPSFAIAKYLAAGGRITPKMKPHVRGGTPYDAWTVDVKP